MAAVAAFYVDFDESWCVLLAQDAAGFYELILNYFDELEKPS